MEQQNKYRVTVSTRAAQMLVSHAAFLAQVSPAAARGSKANTFLKMLTDSSCLKNAICSSSKS